MTLKELSIRLIDGKVKFSIYDYVIESVLCTNRFGRKYFIKILDDHILCISEFGRTYVVSTRKDDLSESELMMRHLSWVKVSASIISMDELLVLLIGEAT